MEKTNKDKAAPSPEGWRIPDILWKAVMVGYAIGLLITIAAGLPILLVMGNSWLMALAGSVGLIIGGLVAGGMAGDRSPVVNGTLMAILYNLTVSLLFFVGSFLEVLPEPLPGLPTGDSIFFFAWPLAQFAIGLLGAVIGSRIFANRMRRTA